jgi:hypothetical protein
MAEFQGVIFFNLANVAFSCLTVGSLQRFVLGLGPLLTLTYEGVEN